MLFRHIGYIILFFVIMISSCREKHKSATEIIVQKPAEMNEKVAQNIEEVLGYATDNDSKINDSVRLNMLPAVRKFYATKDFKNIWNKQAAWLPLADTLYNFIKGSAAYGLFSNDYHFKELSALKSLLKKDTAAKKNAVIWTNADLLLTDGFMQIIRHLKQGRLISDSLSFADTTLSVSFYNDQLTEFLNSKNLTHVLDSLEPKHAGYKSLREVLKNFTDSMDTKNYSYIKYPDKDSIGLIRAVLKRSAQENLIENISLMPDSAELSTLVKKIQKAKKISINGKITSDLVRRLNSTDLERFKRIAINLDRYKTLPQTFPEKYIWVNLPGYYLRVYDHDTIAVESKVIVGKPNTRTPQLTSFITDMITYPQWTIPESIIKKDIIPALKKDPGYLARKGFTLQTVDGDIIDPYSIKWKKYTNTIPYKIRQGSGDDNALGIFKFNFFNPYNVYLHDTNQRYLFKNKSRALSHGCVRVQSWEQLAYYIAANDSINLPPEKKLSYTIDSIKNWIAEKNRKRIIVMNKIPLFIRYYTCEAIKGKIIFYEDIYEEDRILRDKYFSRR